MKNDMVKCCLTECTALLNMSEVEVRNLADSESVALEVERSLGARQNAERKCS